MFPFGIVLIAQLLLAGIIPTHSGATTADALQHKEPASSRSFND